MKTWSPRFDGDFPTLGEQVIDWIAEYLAAPDKSGGEPFILYPEQEDFILRFYEIDLVTMHRKIRRGVISRPKGWGKSPLLAAVTCAESLAPVVFDGWDASGQPVGVPWSRLRTPLAQVSAVSEDQPLALDTIVRTTQGWTTIANIGVGDEVYDEHGSPQAVCRHTPVMYGLDCYRVTFDDGQEVVASASHGWTVERKRLHGDYHITETLTTEDLASGYRDSMGRGRVRIPLVAAGSPDVDLPIDPYILGLWLGDGNRCNGTFAIRWQHRDEIEAILLPLLGSHEMLKFAHVCNDAGVLNIRNTTTHKSSGPALITRLRTLGVLKNKYIPDLYAFAGTEQRRALLQGLIDSDGNVLADGQVRFTNVNRSLIDGTRDLVASLGYKPHVRPHSTAGWIVSFRADAQSPVARLAYKATSQRARSSRYGAYRYVQNVERIPTVPVRCIGIDTPAHLFQVGRGILTQNTRNAWTPLLEMLREGKAIDEFPGLEPLDTFVNLPGKGRIEFVTASARSREGNRPIFCLLDQTESWLPSNGGVRLAATMRRNLGKTGGSSIEAPNAYYPGEGSVSEASAAYWEQIIRGEARDDGLYYDHREASAGTELTDRESLMAGLLVAYGDAAAANGGHVDLERIIAEIYDPATDPQDGRRYYLNQVTHASDSYIWQPEWAGCRVADKHLEPKDVITLGFDGSRGRAKGKPDATALIGCRVTDGHLFEVGVWEAPDGPEQKDWSPPLPEIDAAIDKCFSTYAVAAFYADPAKDWRSKVGEWEAKYGAKVPVKMKRDHPFEWWMVGGRSHFIQVAVESFEAAVRNQEVTHSGEFRLTQHVMNARRRIRNQKLTVGKEHDYSPNKVDACVAAILAWQARLDAVAAGAGSKPKRRAPIRVR